MVFKKIVVLFLSVAVKRFKYSSAMIVSMQNCSPGAQTTGINSMERTGFHHHFFTKFPDFLSGKKKATII